MHIIKIFLLAGFILFSSCLFKGSQKYPYGQVIRVTAKDSLVYLTSSLKNNLSQFLKQSNAGINSHLLLTKANIESAKNVSRWLGAQTQKNIYQINLTGLVSNNIAETEKNIDRVFSKAENNNWILFFDEADALFGKRTDIKNSHDKYANVEIAYLLQKIENYKGLVLLPCISDNCLPKAGQQKFIQISGVQNAAN